MVSVRRQIWPPPANFETTGGISPKPWCMNFSQCLDVSFPKWFLSISKYGRTATIFKIAIWPLLNTVKITLLHILRDHLLDFFKTCLRCSPNCLVMHARKWFWSVDEYGHHRPSLIFTVIASFPKPLEEFCQNLAYEFLVVPRYVCPKTILVCQQIWPNGSHL